MSCQMAEGSELRVRRLEVKRQASLFFNLWTINREILLEIITVSMKCREKVGSGLNYQCKKQKLRKKEAKNCPTN